MNNIELKTTIDDLMWAIHFYQIQDGGDISDLGAEVYNHLITEFGGDPNYDHLSDVTDDQQRVYSYTSDIAYAAGYKCAFYCTEDNHVCDREGVYKQILTKIESDHLTPDQQKIYDYTSENWFRIGFEMLHKIGSLINE